MSLSRHGSILCPPSRLVETSDARRLFHLRHDAVRNPPMPMV
ncbi:hypothetical protein L479_01015 [Exiguobacterium sp. S17]|nr:hypothetical protein L479_01015 [Exiguobacterium sp. S17]